MKKMRFLCAALTMLCAMAMTTALTACGDDNDDNGSNTNDLKPAGVTMTYTFYVTQDMLDYCDIVVSYNDGTGEKTETMKTLEWKKTLTAKLPCTFTFNKTVTLKSDKDISQADKVTYTNRVAFSYGILNAAGNPIGQGRSGEFGVNSTLTGEKVGEIITSGSLNLKQTYTFDLNGNDNNG